MKPVDHGPAAGPWRRRSWVVRVAAAALGLAGLIGFAGCGGGGDDLRREPSAVRLGARLDEPAADAPPPASTPLAEAAAASAPPAGGASFVRAPEDTQAVPGQTVQFSVVVEGRPGLTYQWLRDGEPIVGAIAAQLAFTAEQDDDRARYSVVVGDAGSSLRSRAAELRVKAQ